MGIAATLISAAVASFITPSIVIGGVTLASTFLGSFLIRAAIGLALNALTPKPKTRGTNRGYQITTNGSALDHQIIYGRIRTGGVIVYDGSTGTSNRFLHRVIAFAGHEVESFDEVYINDDLVTLDSEGFATSPPQYVNLLRVKFALGAPDQEALPELVSEVTEWTEQHRLRNIAYAYFRLDANGNAYPNGVPQITCTVSGKKLYDPRTETTVWSDNPALVLRDYLTSGYGLEELDANIDDDLVSTAADVCDETNTVSGNTRFTCNGAFVTQITPYDILNDLLTSMGGLLWYSQGEWRMKPAYYVAPTESFNEDDLRSSIALKTRHSRRDNFNVVRGTFRGEESNWQVTDYPDVSNAAFIAADNGQESVLDLELPFTDNSEEARRIARIVLERNRQQLTFSASFGLKAFKVQTGDIINLSISRFGWVNKEFEVVSWTFGLAEEQDLQVEMSLREISENVFDEVDDGIIYERDNTNLISPFEVPSVGLSAEAETQIIREKLVNVINLTVSSNRPEGVDFVEVEFKKSSEESTQYRSLGTGSLGIYRAVDLESTAYDFRARAINTFGVRGEYEFLDNIQAESLIASPSDVTNFSAQVLDSLVVLEWDAVPDLDLSFYKIRYALEETGATWANSTTASEKVPRPATSISLPSRPGTYLIKAFDKLGIPSENYTTVVVPEEQLQNFANEDTQTEDPTFTGTKTDCVVDSSALRITDPSTGPSTATYDFSTYIDTGTVRRVKTRIDANVERVSDGDGLFDNLPGLFDSLPGLFDDLTGDSDLADTNLIFYVSATDDDPAGTPTWSAYQPFKSTFLSGRAFRFRVVLTSETDDITPSITGLTARVEYD